MRRLPLHHLTSGKDSPDREAQPSENGIAVEISRGLHHRCERLAA
jgi:hypothetical protein